MRIAVLGAGALGTLFAGSLAAERPVTLVGRDDEHLHAIADDGVQIRRPDGSTERYAVDATADHAAVSDADILLIAVKSYDTEAAMADVEPFLERPDVLTLQNGLGNAETIREFVHEEHILAGTTTNGAVIDEPGTVDHTGRGTTTIGRMWTRNDALVDHLAATFRQVGLETTVVDDVERAIWEKVLVNVGINPLSALSRVSNGQIIAVPAGERVLETAVEEAHRVARADGHQFDRDPVQVTRQVASDTGPNRSSMLQDVERGSRTEIDALNGAVVDRAARHDIGVPVNRTLTDCIRLLESGSGTGESAAPPEPTEDSKT